jgi:hypothetical protein
MLTTNSVATPYQARPAPESPTCTSPTLPCVFVTGEGCGTARDTAPLPLAALTGNATAAGWKTIQSWYLVSNQDNAIPPEAEVFVADRVGARREPTHVSPARGGFAQTPEALIAMVRVLRR